MENIAKVFYAPPATGQSPSLSLWEKYSNLGMKVSHMKKYLGKLKWEKELILLQKQSGLHVHWYVKLWLSLHVIDKNYFLRPGFSTEGRLLNASCVCVHGCVY